MGYDPDADEGKKFSAEDFVAAAKEELDKWLVDQREALAASERRTWRDWFRDFFNYMSF